MGQLTVADKQSAAYLRKLGVLKDVVPNRIPEEMASNGFILNCCADGDEFHDLHTHLAEVCLEHRDTPRIHVLSRMGGALVIPPSSPLYREGYAKDLVDDILASYRIKGINFVALYAHAPCGAATLANITLAEELEILAEAKTELKRIAHSAGIELKVACLFHIDRGDSKRTYFFPVGQWRLLTRSKPVRRGEPWPPTQQADSL